jgi:two-component system, NtrC family, sensor kinase
MSMPPAPSVQPAPRALRHPPRELPLVVFMVLAVVAVGLLAFWDAERESAASLDDFAQEQAMLAGSMASELAAHLTAARRDAALSPARGDVEARAALATIAARVERPGAVRVLLLELDRARDGDDVHAGDGQILRSPPIRAAFERGLSSVWLGRDDAAALGLPHRRAAVGLAQIDAGPLGRFGIAVANSAERERDRELRARFRLGLSLLAAVGLVFAFGSVALRQQRQRLVLAGELALTDLRRERDGRLAAASRAATMGTLAMGIAHEISTPLGIIVGRAEQLVPRLAEDERGARSLDAILAQGERIRRVIQGFLDLARGGAPTLGDVEPAAVLGGAIALVEHRFAAAEIALTQEIAADLPLIHGDLAMLEQALVNLLLNACDACKRRGHVVARVASEGDRVAFTVLDDGAGITTENAARAAEPFFTTKPAGHGTGLGLAITNEIVKLHRGRLLIEPASPRGTRASVILPASQGPAEASAG